MDYHRIYTNLINNAKGRYVYRRELYHLHHIVPRSMGGGNDYTNLVYLTHKEHLLAHTLLAMEYPNQWFSVELLVKGTSNLKLARWKRKRIWFRRQQLYKLNKCV